MNRPRFYKGRIEMRMRARRLMAHPHLHFGASSQTRFLRLSEMGKPVIWLDTIPLSKIRQQDAQQPRTIRAMSKEMLCAASAESPRNGTRKCPGSIPATSKQSRRAVPRSRPHGGHESSEFASSGELRNSRRNVHAFSRSIQSVDRDTGRASAESVNSLRSCPVRICGSSVKSPQSRAGNAHGQYTARN
jgi:hypothetical protein